MMILKIGKKIKYLRMEAFSINQNFFIYCFGCRNDNFKLDMNKIYKFEIIRKYTPQK